MYLEKKNSGGVALNVDLNFGDSSLSSITAWRKWSIDEFNEADGLSNSSIKTPHFSIWTIKISCMNDIKISIFIDIF